MNKQTEKCWTSQDRHGSGTHRPSVLQGRIKNTKDPKGKETFSRMAEEEMGHFNDLRHHTSPSSRRENMIQQEAYQKP